MTVQLHDELPAVFVADLDRHAHRDDFQGLYARSPNPVGLTLRVGLKPDTGT